MNEKMKPIIDILIPAVNNSYFTSSLIKSIKMNTDIPYRIIYIDNGSERSELDNVLQSLKETNNLVIRNEKNLGFVKAINQGLRVSKATYICFQNNDTLVFKDCFKNLIQHLEKNNNSGIISPIASIGGGKQGIEIIKSMYDWFEDEISYLDIARCSHEEINTFLFQKFQKKAVEVSRSIAFFSVVMHRDTFEKVGCLDERYGLGLYDDDDYCQRIVGCGSKIWLAFDVYVWHLASTTFKKMYSNNGLMEMLAKNRLVYDEKWNT
jgi:GT2 family glycosyltransferase